MKAVNVNVSCYSSMQAAYTSGDRVWRMPLFNLYNKQVQSDWADLINLGKKPR